jgi:hypothetical protein
LLSQTFFERLLIAFDICRFSKLRSSAGGQKLAGKAQGRRQNIAEVQKQSRQTNRLNQQMERRATVNAALKLKKVC